MIRIITVLLLLVACGKDDLARRQEPILDEMRLDFIAQCEKFDHKGCLAKADSMMIYAVAKDSLNSNDEVKAAGKCIHPINQVLIDESVLTDKLLKNLVFHEFGHCLLDAKHGTGVMMLTPVENIIPEGELWDAVVKELFDTNRGE